MRNCLLEYGVRRIKEYNVTLLRQWCWRLREKRERLWFRVLVVRYWEEGGRIKDGGRFDFVWL